MPRPVYTYTLSLSREFPPSAYKGTGTRQTDGWTDTAPRFIIPPPMEVGA